MLLRGLLVTALGAGALLAGAASAGAATVSVSSAPGFCMKGSCDPSTGSVDFVDAGEETNAVRVSRGGIGFVFHDTGAALTAQAPCRQIDPNTAECPSPPAEITGVWLRLGGGNDRVEALTSVRADGEAGDDVLVVTAPGASGGFSGGPGRDELTGGDLGDSLVGGDDADRLTGNGGDDGLISTDYNRTETTVADVLDGGPGRDGVGYHGPTPVTVDLPAGTGAGDTLIGIEDVLTGNGDDVVIGDDGPNDLDAQNGNDVVRGGGGNDRLRGVGAGAQLSGEGGDDLLEPGPSVRAAPSCGDGIDRVRLVITIRSLDASCELFLTQASSGTVLTTTQPVALTGRAVTFALTCEAEGVRGECAQPITVQTAERLGSKRRCRRVRGKRRCTTRKVRVTLGSVPFVPVPIGTRREVTVPFTPAGRRLLTRRVGPPLRVRVIVSPPASGYGWETTLALP